MIGSLAMKNNRVLLGYLTFINESNMTRRYKNFQQSLASLNLIKNQDCDTVSFDNNSCQSIKDELVKFKFNYYCHFNSNYYDLSVLYGTYYLARKLKYDYMLYAYDDIMLFNNDFIKDSVLFLDKNIDVDCVRVCEYRRNDKNFNTRHVIKQKNPDAINHWASHKNNSPLSWEMSQQFGKNTFHINDWHYTSRSTIFRVNSFEKMITGYDRLPVLNFFEGHAYSYNKAHGIKTGILEGGAFRTLAKHTHENSERLNLGNKFLKNVSICVKDIENNMNAVFENSIHRVCEV